MPVPRRGAEASADAQQDQEPARPPTAHRTAARPSPSPYLFPVRDQRRGVQKGCRSADHAGRRAVTCWFASQPLVGREQLSAGLSEGLWAWSGAVLSHRDRGRALMVALVVGADWCPASYARRPDNEVGAAGRGSGPLTDVDTGGRDQLAVAVLAQYRMATTEQLHLILSPDVRIEQTRHRLVKPTGPRLVHHPVRSTGGVRVARAARPPTPAGRA